MPTATPLLPSPAISVRFKSGPPLQAALRDPRRRGIAARVGEAVATRWPVGPCEVVVMDNRSTIWSVRPRPGSVRVTVHWTLLDQERDLVAAMTRRDAGASERLLAYYQMWQQTRAAEGVLPMPDEPELRPAGRVYDLKALFDQQNEQQFGSALAAPIGWGRVAGVGPSRRIRLGSCGGTPPRIRLHPVLDHPFVPLPFVRFIVFHEMLHLALPPEPARGGRRRVHPPAFRARERRHPDWAVSVDWEEEHVGWLLERACALANSP